MRHIFIGDIQGCCTELHRLLDELRFDPASDHLEPVGDVVNRGPDSVGTLELLHSLNAGGVLGNHDIHLLRVAAGLKEPRTNDRLADILGSPRREELLAWLARRPFAKRVAGATLVHGGLNPKWSDPVEQLTGLDPLVPHPDSDFATLVRHCSATGERPERGQERADEAFRPWFEHWRDRDEAMIVFGHWAQRGLVHGPGLRGLDTGCVWGGKLSGWVAEEDRLIQIPAEKTYAPVGS